MPMIAASWPPRRNAARTSYTHRTATGRSAGPLTPPASKSSTGSPESTLITMPGPSVLTAVMPSAPPSTAARATSPSACTLGEILTSSGRSVTCRTARVISSVASGVPWPASVP